jgi:hypothetical protein
MCPWCDGDNHVHDTDAAFRQHITSNHDTSFSDAEIFLITKSNQQSRPFECCLICGLSGGLSNAPEGTPQTTTGRQTDIINCMVNHLEVLALGSIPWHIGDMDDARSDEAENTDRAIVLEVVGDATGVGIGESDFAGVGGVYATDDNGKAEVSGMSGDLDPIGGLMYRGELGSITASAPPPASLRDRVTTWFTQGAFEEQLLATASESEDPEIDRPDQSARKRHKTGSPEDSATTRSNRMNALQMYLSWISRPRVDSTDVDDFVPAGEVDGYLRHRSALEDIFDDVFPSASDRPSAGQILQDYPLVFTILLSSGMGAWIGVFLKHESLCDSNLPFRINATSSRTDETYRKTYTVPLASASLSPSSLERAASRSLNGLPSSLFETFQATQARICAPKLTEGCCYEFDADEILPYLEKQPIGEGGGAKVYRVKVHANHDFMRRLDNNVRISPARPDQQIRYIIRARHPPRTATTL